MHYIVWLHKNKKGMKIDRPILSQWLRLPWRMMVSPSWCRSPSSSPLSAPHPWMSPLKKKKKMSSWMWWWCMWLLNFSSLSLLFYLWSSPTLYYFLPPSSSVYILLLYFLSSPSRITFPLMARVYLPKTTSQIGRASCRERVCLYV